VLESILADDKICATGKAIRAVDRSVPELGSKAQEFGSRIPAFVATVILYCR
jgi:hypothetical protein